MVLADKREYISGYKKHYFTYLSLKQTNSSVRSRRLLLVYCVECGLKYLLLGSWHENSPKEIIENKEDKRSGIIGGHNLEIMLKELGQAGVFKFPHMTTIHQDNVFIGNFHELCRYNIGLKKEDTVKEDQYELELQKIAEWIREEI